MLQPAIEVHGLSKQYRIGSSPVHATLRERLGHAVAAPLRHLRRGTGWEPSSRAARFIWALEDVSFDVAPGEVVGVIGRNGAGKSTLLKILSRIAQPTRGQALFRGRLGSLLEVGTGFHPELTGRENVYLNGAILGMKRLDIARKFDDIVAFAGTEKFIDTPVKHYSSGMYVRLAFSVAAHLETEILLVDEVLAVGDAAFQLKCLNRMSEVASCGRTIVFVSHNMEAVAALCGRVILLEGGRVSLLGTPHACIERYLSRNDQARAVLAMSLRDHPGRTKHHNGPVELTSLRLSSGEASRIASGQPFEATIGYTLRNGSRRQETTFHLTFSNIYNHRIAQCRSHDTCRQPIEVTAAGELVCRISRLPLMPGAYRLSIGCTTEAGYSDVVYDATTFEVTGGPFYASGTMPGRAGGDVLFDHEWTVVVAAAHSV